MDELVKVDWLQWHLDDPDLVILEATGRPSLTTVHQVDAGCGH